MDHDLTPLGELLEAARLRHRPRLSQNAAAKKAGTSSTTYRRIVKGVARFGGQDVPFEGTPDTVARIAMALGVTPDQVRAVGRGDAAAEMEIAERPATEEEIAAATQGVLEGMSLEEALDAVEELMGRVEEKIDERRRRRVRQAWELTRGLVEESTDKPSNR